MLDCITDVDGIKVGHAQNYEAGTGCTVVLCEKGATAGVDVRGGAPGTRETDLLDPKNLIDKVHAIYLSGGSAFGLAGANGVMHFLEEHEIGFDVGVTKVPIVPGAVLFDLTVGDCKTRPDFDMGYTACLNATKNNDLMGNVGAGTGATVGKFFGEEYSMKGGLGTASIQLRDVDLVVGAIVAVNCLGDVVDPDSGNILAGALNKSKDGFANTIENIMLKTNALNTLGRNTTIGVVATNAKLSKAQASKVASMAHNGYARTIRPVHTLSDGDTIFCISTGNLEIDISVIGTLAAKAMEKAIVRAVKKADPKYGKPAYRSLCMKNA